MKEEELNNIKNALSEFLASYRINATIEGVKDTPLSVILILRLAPNVSVAKIKSNKKNIQFALGAKEIELLIPMPGTTDIGIKILKNVPESKRLFTIFKSDDYSKRIHSNKYILPYVVGIDDKGTLILNDFNIGGHLLVAGTTGSGKSVFLNSLVACMLRQSLKSPVKLILVDTIGVNFSGYNGLPQLLFPVITNRNDALRVLSWLCKEMNARSPVLQYNDLEQYNKQCEGKLARIIAVIDDFADLVDDECLTESVMNSINSIIIYGKKVGIHLVISTQRPTVQFISKQIKDRISDKISFTVSSKIDSRIVLNEEGAESLGTRGELLFRSKNDPNLIHCLAPYISNENIMNMVEKLKQQHYPY